jgi:hypothetical protein
MASLVRDKSGNYLVAFRWERRQFTRSLGTREAKQARSHLSRVEDTLSDLKVGRLKLPEGAEPGEFIVSCGTRTRKPAVDEEPAVGTLGELLDLYGAEPPPHLEGSTLRMQAIHARRILEILPRGLTLAELDKAAAQSYAERRSKRKYRGKAIHRDTIAKELKSLLYAWKWVAGKDREVALPPFALRDLKLPKGDEPARSWTGTSAPRHVAVLTLINMPPGSALVPRPGFEPALPFATAPDGDSAVRVGGDPRHQSLRRSSDYERDPK